MGRMRTKMCCGVLAFFFCLALVRGGPTLFFADSGGVFRLEEGSRRPVEIPNTRSLSGLSLSVDYDAKEGRLYWTDFSLQFIRSAYVNGTDSKLFKQLNHLALPWSVVIDDVSRLVFYADGGNDVIAMVTMREGYLHTVLDRGLDSPFSLALDTSRGVVFYTDTGSRPRIASINYDGSGHKMLITSNVYSPTGIALDPSGGFVYWCDNSLGRLESFDYRGSQGRQLLLYTERAQFYALDLFGDSLYFSAWNHSYIRRLPRDGGNTSIVELDDPLSGYVLGLRVVDLNQTISSPADPAGCGCSHICVSGGGQSWRCLCPDGLSLSADSKTCTTDPNLDRFVLFEDWDLRRLFRMDLDTGSYVELPINVARTGGIDYDVIEGRVYWSDVLRNVIASARLDGSGYTVIRQLNDLAVPEGLELDPKARLVFYSDSGNDVIGSISMYDSTHREVFTVNLDQPRALALDIEMRLVYYTDVGSRPRIGRFTYEGQQPQVLVSSGLTFPNGLTLDRTDERLYWCDSSTDQIESVKTDGTNRRLLLRMPGSNFFGIDLHNGYLYYTDWNARNLSKIRTDGNGRGVVGPSDFRSLCDLHVVDKQQALQAIGRPTLLFTDRWGVHRLEEGSRRPVRIPNTGLPKGLSLSVDYDAKERRLYWTDYNLKFIYSAYVNGTDSKLFRQLNHLAVPWSVVIDAVSRLVFYADGGNDVIAMVTMREGYLHTVLDTDLEDPTSLALDTSRGVVFYTDTGSRPKIASVNYDGSGHKMLITSNLYDPAGITLDPSAGFLYWCDFVLGRLESFDYRGSKGRQLLLYINRAMFHALDLYGDSIYFSAWNHSYIRRLPRNGGNTSTVELDDPLFDQVLGLRVVDLNQTISSPADPAGCGCSHICVSGGGQSWKCLCPDGLSLSADSKTCTTAAQTSGSPVIIGSAVGGIVLVILVIVVIVVFVVRRKQPLPKGAGGSQGTCNAHHGRQNDSDYAHLHERGQIPMQVQVNMTASSGVIAEDFSSCHENKCDDSIYDTVEHYTNFPPVNSEF